MKNKYLINEAVINVKIPIKVDDYLKEFIFKNINMRRKIWNDFVEEANKYKDEYNNYYGFKPRQYKTEYHRTVEKPSNRYEEYCVGLSEQVADDMIVALKTIKTKNNKVFNNKTGNRLGSLKFHKRNNYYGSFKVKTKNDTNDKGDYKGRITIKNNNLLEFSVRYRGYENKERLKIELLESLYDDYDNITEEYIRYYSDNRYSKQHECRFCMDDIKEISFIHDLGKFYIQLSIKVRYHINNKEVKNRTIYKLGIDTGIHHPFMIYNGKDYFSLRMDDKISNKIHYLERRANRLQNIMSKKYKYNKDHGLNPYSNNYNKVRLKFRRIWKKIVNIKRHWSYCICKKLVIMCKNIIVDRFEQPVGWSKEMKNLPNKVKRTINYNNRFHNMFNTNIILIHMANKYGCNYYTAPKGTTCTCSKCNHINPHLPLSQRVFKCEKCGYTIDRDMNASKNCYDFIS